MTTDEKRRRIYRFALIGLAVAVAIVECVGFRAFCVDDAGISFSYARTWVAGHGLVLQPGAERVEGYSNFLWVVFLALGSLVRGELVLWSHILGAASAAGTAIFSAELAAALRGTRRPSDGIFALAAVLLTPVTYWAMSGLEGGLFVCLVTAVAARLAFEIETPERFPWSAVAAAALALTRPDGVLYVALVVAVRLVLVRRRIVLGTLLTLAPPVLHHLWRFRYYGFWFPNTFYVKAPAPLHLGDRFAPGSQGWIYIWKIVEEYRLTGVLVASVLSILIADRRVRRLPALGAILAVGFFALYAQGDWMSEGRFVVAAMPALVVMTCDLLASIGSGPALGVARLSARVRYGLAGVLALGAAGYLLPLWVKTTWSRIGRYPITLKYVAERGMAVTDLAQKLGVPAPSLLDGDLGGTSYYGKVRMVDLGALADVTIARYQHDLPLLRDYVLGEQRPTFMRLNGFWMRSALHLYAESFEEYVAVAHHGSKWQGIFMRRDAVMVDGIDVRSVLHAFASVPMDLIGADVDEREARLWVRIRGEVRTPILLSSAEGQTTVRIADGAFPQSQWKAGDVVHLSAQRPIGGVTQLCAGDECTTLEDGKHGAQPLAPLEWPRGDGERALELGLRYRDAGQTAAAFRTLRDAVAWKPALSIARREAEKLRPLLHATTTTAARAELAVAERAFHLAPSEKALSRLGRAALAADDRMPLVRAHLATTLAPDDESVRAALAVALVELQKREAALALLPSLLPGLDTLALADALGDTALGQASIAALPKLPGALRYAAAQPLPSGDIELRILVADQACRDPQRPGTLRIDGHARVYTRCYAALGLGELRLTVPAESRTVDVDGQPLRLDVDPFTTSFEHGRADGWTATGLAFAGGPHDTHHASAVLGLRADRTFDAFLHCDGAFWAMPMPRNVDARTAPALGLSLFEAPKEFVLSQLTYLLFQPGVGWLRDIIGVDGHGLVDTALLGDFPTGTMRSRPLDAVDEACFLIGGGAVDVGVRVRIGDELIATQHGYGDETLRRSCVQVGGRAGAVIEIFDESTAPWGHVLFDGLECRRSGWPVRCAGNARLATP